MKRFLLLLLALSATLCRAQGQSVAGDWKGELVADALRMRVGLAIVQGDSGLKGTLDLIDQAMNGLPLTEVALTDSSLSFKLGSATYTGKLAADGTIDGRWEQPGQSMELDFERGKWSISRPQTPQGPFPYRIEDVSYPNPKAEGVTLSGTITVPEGPGPFPAVILISGSGPQNRDEDIMMHKPFWVIADHLSRNGVAVLRFDDRGVGKSTGKHSVATSADFATDVEAGVAYLSGRTDLPIGKIGLAGHSEGGLIAPMVAVASPKVAFLVLLAGTGVRGKELLLEQSALVTESIGMPEDEARQARETNARLFDIILKGKSMKKMRPKLEKCLQDAAKAQDTTVSQATINATISQIASPWMQFFIRHDPATVLEQVQCPVLVLNGSRDVQVSAAQNVPAIEAALRKGGNTQVKSIVFPGLNHFFQHCEDCTVAEYGRIEETISPEVLAAISTWVLATAR